MAFVVVGCRGAGNHALHTYFALSGVKRQGLFREEDFYRNRQHLAAGTLPLTLDWMWRNLSQTPRHHYHAGHCLPVEPPEHARVIHIHRDARDRAVALYRKNAAKPDSKVRKQNLSFHRWITTTDAAFRDAKISNWAYIKGVFQLKFEDLRDSKERRQQMMEYLKLPFIDPEFWGYHVEDTVNHYSGRTSDWKEWFSPDLEEKFWTKWDMAMK